MGGHVIVSHASEQPNHETTTKRIWVRLCMVFEAVVGSRVNPVGVSPKRVYSVSVEMLASVARDGRIARWASM